MEAGRGPTKNRKSEIYLLGEPQTANSGSPDPRRKKKKKKLKFWSHDLWEILMRSRGFCWFSITRLSGGFIAHLDKLIRGMGGSDSMI